MHNPNYDILFEPIRIGPVTAPNRFYQVPHCAGAGSVYPNANAALRAMKAEGGWGVINTEYCSIHPTTDTAPAASLRLWSDEDIDGARLISDSIHMHGALAGIELSHMGLWAHMRHSRLPQLGPSPSMRKFVEDFPGQGRAMERADIVNFRQWHRKAVARSLEAGFDIVYIYAGGGVTLFSDFLDPERNKRTDEYGGPIENRARLLREVIEDSKEILEGKAALAVRVCVDDLGNGGITGEDGRSLIELLAEEPDLWDITVGAGYELATSRFEQEGWQAKHMSWVKTVTSKPVVSVGRVTSPDTMVRLIKSGVTDFVGAARPSIADPFIPTKIREGRPEDIRECIGCNICLSSHRLGALIRCTQNPTMGEEWRRGWHPEKMQPAKSADTVLVIGGGPAGLEASLSLARRGYEVTLADSGSELGGHLLEIGKLPRFREWLRVRDYRAGQLAKMANVNIYLESELTADDVLNFGANHVVLATGSGWSRESIGLYGLHAAAGTDQPHVFNLTDALAATIEGPVVIYDDDHYVVGTGAAEFFRERGHEVTLVTPGALPSAWTVATSEQEWIHKRMVASGIKIITNHLLTRVGSDSVFIDGMSGEATQAIPAAAVVLVTMRESRASLHQELVSRRSEWEASRISSVNLIGDANVPRLLAEAIASGHRFAREFQEVVEDVPFAVERVTLVERKHPAPAQARSISYS